MAFSGGKMRTDKRNFRQGNSCVRARLNRGIRYIANTLNRVEERDLSSDK